MIGKWILLAASLSCWVSGHTMSGNAYLERYNRYVFWSDELPESPSSDFLQFIDSDKPLSQKLRAKWLFKLAQDKNWALYHQYYRESKDVRLQCYALQAQYHLGEKDKALRASEKIWLTGSSLPKACDPLWDAMLKWDDFDEKLIGMRIRLALERRNLNLARYLLKLYKNSRLADAKNLFKIYHQPGSINQLSAGGLHDDFYLYGLNRMVSRNMDKAVLFWKHVQKRKLLNEHQQQVFLSHLALYKAMRDHKDAYLWFKKVKPEYHQTVLLDWQIRSALKQQRWPRVVKLINGHPDKNDPGWQYWLARAYEAQGQQAQATAIYKKLSPKRQYYGFLASHQLKKPLSFKEEAASNPVLVVKDYQPFLNHVKQLYQANQRHQAAVALRDFSLELNKQQFSALAAWVSSELNWPGISLYLINQRKGLKNQLKLRFPLAYQNDIGAFAEKFNIKKEFIYAIIRQESAFRKQAVSHAGAYGLMQVMPDTAKNVARKAQIPYKQRSQLFDENKNINIGVAYLSQLSTKFNDHPVLMAAAYNAGPRRVDYWLKNHHAKDVDIWIETLPWHETRNYLKNVLAFYAVYQYRMNKKPDLEMFFKPI